MRQRTPCGIATGICIALVVLLARPLPAAPARAAANARAATSTHAATYQPTLPPASPALPLRLVARQTIGMDQYCFRLSDGSAWVDIGGARSRLRRNTLVQVSHAPLGGAVSIVAGSERRRVRLLNCTSPVDNLDAQRCSVLQDAPGAFE